MAADDQMSDAERVLLYMLDEGPAPYVDIGVAEVPVAAKMVGVDTFHPSISSRKGPCGTANGSGNRAVVYHREEHDADEVIHAWFDANPRLEDANPRAVLQAICTYGGEFAEEASNVVYDRIAERPWPSYKDRDG